MFFVRVFSLKKVENRSKSLTDVDLSGDLFDTRV